MLSNRVLEWGILLFAAGAILLACNTCAAKAHAAVQEPQPEPVRERYTLPWTAKDSDVFCVQPNIVSQGQCITVGQLRLFVRTYQLAEP